MLTYEIAAMLCIATFAFGMGMGVFAVDMMRRAQSVPMHEPIENFEPKDFVGYMTPDSKAPELPTWWKSEPREWR